MKTFKEYLEAASKQKKDPEDYPFTVWRIVKDPYEIKRSLQGFNTQAEADEFAKEQRKHENYWGWKTTYEVVEN